MLRTGVHLEGTSKALDSWAYENGVTLDVSRPGKPTDNALGETFNDSLRDECLNVRCGSAWKRDPGNGVIGVERGPLIPVV